MQNTFFRTNSIKKKNRKQDGIVLEGFNLVMLIVGIMLIAALLWYLNNLRLNSISANTSELTSIAATAKKKYGQANEYESLTTSNAVLGNIIPPWLRNGTSATASNSYGGAITVTPTDLTGTNDSVNVAWPNVPKNECSDIVAGLDKVARRIQVAGVDVKATDTKMNMTTLETQCDSADVLLINMYVGR